MHRASVMVMLTIAGLVACGEPESLESQVASIVGRHPEATVAVAVRDGDFTLDIQSDRSFHAASTMKVPVMIETWRRAREGSLDLSMPLEVKNEFHSIVDSSLYSIEEDTDDAIYERLGETMTVTELVYQMITVSSNLATNLLIDYLGAELIQNTVNSLDAPGMQVLRGVEDLKAFDLGLSNETTAAALAQIMEAIMLGEAVDPAADRSMVGVMLDAAFNEMIPAGLPEGTRTAHKTGQITRIHHDAAIIYPPQAEPYVLVILIEGLDDDDVSAELGIDITRAVHAALRSDA